MFYINSKYKPLITVAFVLAMVFLYRKGGRRHGDIFWLQTQERGLYLPGGARGGRDESSSTKAKCCLLQRPGAKGTVVSLAVATVWSPRVCLWCDMAPVWLPEPILSNIDSYCDSTRSTTVLFRRVPEAPLHQQYVLKSFFFLFFFWKLHQSTQSRSRTSWNTIDFIYK